MSAPPTKYKTMEPHVTFNRFFTYGFHKFENGKQHKMFVDRYKFETADNPSKSRECLRRSPRLELSA